MTLPDFLKEWNNTADTVAVRTSGSTGTPKTLLVEKRRMLASARMTCGFLNLKAGDSALLCMSLDYIGAKMMVVRAVERNLRLPKLLKKLILRLWFRFRFTTRCKFTMSGKN